LVCGEFSGAVSTRFLVTELRMRNLFPYPFRERQAGVIEFIQREIKGKICLDAPTGFGKTPVILGALLPLVESEGFKIIWAVRTGTRHTPRGGSSDYFRIVSGGVERVKASELRRKLKAKLLSKRWNVGKN